MTSSKKRVPSGGKWVKAPAKAQRQIIVHVEDKTFSPSRGPSSPAPWKIPKPAPKPTQQKSSS